MHTRVHMVQLLILVEFLIAAPPSLQLIWRQSRKLLLLCVCVWGLSGFNLPDVQIFVYEVHVIPRHHVWAFRCFL